MADAKIAVLDRIACVQVSPWMLRWRDVAKNIKSVGRFVDWHESQIMQRMNMRLDTSAVPIIPSSSAIDLGILFVIMLTSDFLGVVAF